MAVTGGDAAGADTAAAGADVTTGDVTTGDVTTGDVTIGDVTTGRRWPVDLVAIAALATAIRIVIYLAVYRHRQFGFNDAPYYSQQAVQLAHGHWFTDPATGAPVGEHGPLTSMVLAPLSWFGQPAEWQRLGSLAIGVAAVVLIGLTAYELAGRRAGTIAALAAAVYPNLWINDGIVMSESLTALVIAAWLLVGVRWVHEPSMRRAVLVGVVAGLAALTRSELIVLVPGALIAIWRTRPERPWRQAAVLCVAATAALAPWVGPNLLRFERPVLLSTNDGTTLRGANCDRAYSGRAMGSWSIFCLVIEPDTVALEPSIRTGRWRSDALHYAGGHAGRVPLVVAARVGRSLDVFGLGYQVDEDVRDGRPRLGSWLAIVSFWIAAPLAAFGLSRRRGPTAWVLWMPVVAVLITTVAFYGGHRIRTPLEPVIALGVGLALDQAVRAVRRRRADEPRSGDDQPRLASNQSSIAL